MTSKSFLLLTFLYISRLPPISTLFPYTTLFRSYRPACAYGRLATWEGSSAALSGAALLSSWMWSRYWAMTVSKVRSEEHTSELQSRENLVCRLLLEKKKNIFYYMGSI